MIIGIDLGTTNSLVGILEKGRPKLFTAENGSPLIPSVVHFSESLPIVGAMAKEKKTSDPTNTIYSAKRFIGRGISDVKEWVDVLPFDFSPSDQQMVRFKVVNRIVTPIEVSSLILKKLKNLAENTLGQKVEKAVITVPAYFNDAQRQATKFAGELAGLEVARIINEPTAACLAYGLDKKAHGVVAVFDLGGGTFDISILRIQDGIFEVLATNGKTDLGGDDFDHAISNSLRNQILEHKIADPYRNHEERAKLLSDAEKIKRQLSDSETVHFEWGSFKTSINRNDLNHLILPLLEKVKIPCLECLSDAKVKRQQISDVILVGGSTKTPLVKNFVQELFGREPICTLNPDEVVAVGAAVSANILSGQLGGMLLIDVLPLSLGIETMGGVVSKIIHRNSTIPVSASETYSTYVDGQISVDIHVCQGEREMVSDNRSLSRFQLTGLPPMPAGIPKIEVEFIVDANGILNVRAIELRTGKTASVTVNPSYGLNDTEVEQMLMASFENAEADFQARFLVEARVEASGLVTAAKKAFNKERLLVNIEEQKSIEALILQLELSITGSDHKIIKNAISALNEGTKHLAELILDKAIASALKDKEII